MRRKLVESVSAALRSWFPQQPPQPRPRRRLAFEALESRLLLSADLMPLDGVLQIAGTEAADSVLIREVDGAALEVVLNDRALRFDLEGLEAIKVDLLGGHDTLEVDVATALDWTIDLGEGDNATRIRFGDGEPGARLPSGENNIRVEYRSGAGNDTVALELTHVVQQDDTSPDAPTPARFLISTGGGDDFIDAVLAAPGPPNLPAAGVDLAILAGAGVDAVIVDATGAFAEFDLSVDLGADAAANEIAVETLALSFEEIRVDYRAQSRHSYQADGESDGASARYEVELRSDGERMQASHRIETVGGVVSDQVDIQVGGGQTQSVGGLATVSVGSQTGTVDHKETITIHGNSTEDVGADVRVAILGANNLGMASAVAIALGGERPVAVHKIFEDNARTGVSSRTEVLGGAGDDRIEVDVSGGAAPIVTGAGAGGAPQVNVFKGEVTGIEPAFFPYGPSFTGGVRVATGDVNGDGTADIITGAGPGGGPHVKVLDGRSGAELASFFAYDPAFAGGVYVAAGDVNGDGFADIVTGTGAGAPAHVKVFDGRTGAELRSFFAYDTGFTGGVYVAAGDVNGDGRDDIVTGADAGGGPHVKVFDGLTLAVERSFFAYTPGFTGGVRVAAGDVNGDGLADIVTGAGPGGGPHVKVFDARSGAELRSFFAYDPGFFGGVYVATGVTHSAGPVALDLSIDAGGGNDAISIHFNPKELTIDKPVPWQVDVDGGDGIDALSIETGDVAVTARVMEISGFKMEVDVIEHPVATVDMAGLEAFALQTGSGDDRILLDIDRPSAPLPALSFSTGGGDDVVKGKVNTAGSQGGGGIFNAGVVMGTGSDVVDLRVVHSGDARSSLTIELGGADAGRPESGDEVLVVFEHGDARQPIIIGTLWNSQDKPGEEQKSLRLAMASAGGTLEWSAELRGGSGEDHVRFSFEGKLRVARDAPTLRGLVDLGGGDDSLAIDLSKLGIAGRTSAAPIQVAAIGGEGDDALVVEGTRRADVFLVGEAEITLKGAAVVSHEGFESVLVQGGAGNDRMIAVDAPAGTTLDGGPGKDVIEGKRERDAPSRNFADWALPVQADPSARSRGARGR